MRAKKWAALAGLVLAFAACGASPDSPGESSPPVFVGSAPSVAGGPEVGPGIAGPSVGGAAGEADVGSPGVGVTCTVPEVADPVFGAQAFSYLTPAHTELYSWATDEQAAALRTDQVLFPPTATAAMNPISETLQRIAAGSDSSAPVAKILSASLGSARVAWPEPWTVRIGPAGEDRGKNLLRIVLKPEAWLAIVEDGGLQVVDMQSQPVTLADAAAAPDRFGAIFHQRDGSEGGPQCSGPSGGVSVGFREFIVSNVAMVQEWSLGTAAIRAHLQDNIDQLSKFLAHTRSCPDQNTQSTWNQAVMCGWRLGIQVSDELFAYQQALAIPTPDYFDAPPQLAALIDKLQTDLFEPDPLVVTPGSP